MSRKHMCLHHKTPRGLIISYEVKRHLQRLRARLPWWLLRGTQLVIKVKRHPVAPAGAFRDGNAAAERGRNGFSFSNMWQNLKKWGKKKSPLRVSGRKDNPSASTVVFGWCPCSTSCPPKCFQNAGMFRHCSFFLTRKAAVCVYKVTWWQSLF